VIFYRPATGRGEEKGEGEACSFPGNRRGRKIIGGSLPLSTFRLKYRKGGGGGMFLFSLSFYPRKGGGEKVSAFLLIYFSRKARKETRCCTNKRDYELLAAMGMGREEGKVAAFKVLATT